MKLISVLLPSELNVANCLLQTVSNRIGSFAGVYKIKKSSVCARSLYKLQCHGALADATK